MRKEALSRGQSGLDLGSAPSGMVDQLRVLTDNAMIAKENKIKASEAAQQARVAFNELIRERDKAREDEQLAATKGGAQATAEAIV